MTGSPVLNFVMLFFDEPVQGMVWCDVVGDLRTVRKMTHCLKASTTE
jgi:hypothetical protein